MLALKIIVLINFISLFSVTLSGLPSIFPVCFRNDPQLSDCIIQAVKALQPKLITGDLGDGFKIPRLDPFYIPKIIFGVENVIKTRLTHAYLRGLSNFTIDNLQVDINQLRFDMYLSFPRLDLTANYQMVFALFGSPLFSEGQVYEILSNVKVRVAFKAKIYYINEDQHLKFDPFYFKILQNTVKFIDFSNLFPNTIFIRPIIHNYLVNNIGYVTQTIYPDFERSLSDTFTNVANELATGATFDELFPV